MRVHSFHLSFVLVCVLFVASFSNADHDQQQFEIMGLAQCADCQLNNFKTSHAFSGLHVTIDCKLKKGIKRVGDSEVDEGGKFKISISKEIVRQVQFLKKKCYAQLHNAAAVPCPAHDGLETAKIEFKSQIDNKIIFSPAKNLQFSSALCTSKLLWPFFDYPPLPKTDPWKKDWPEITFPPLQDIGNPWSLPPTYKPKPKFKPSIFKPFPPPVPTYKPMPKFEPPVYNPLPPPVPIYKPPSKPIPPPFYKPIPKPPMVKPLPPPVPIYKPLPPQVPVYKPLPPPVPIYKPPVVKPLPPPVPIYKPPVVKPLPPPAPIYEPPVVSKPLPPPFPLFPLPPLYKKKKPCPPFTKMPPKYFEHPKFGYFPKLPPFDPYP